MTARDDPTIIFILGMPFSGSTLAAAALGSSENVFNCGEVSYVEKDWKPRRLCSCGETLEQCPFWSAMRTEMDASAAQGLPGLHFGENRELRPLDARSRWREMLAYIFDRPLTRVYDRAELKLYADDHAGFFRAVKQLTGAKYVVDASKNPRRLEALLDYADLPVKIIHWQRSPAGAFGARLKRARKRNRFYASGLAPFYLLWTIAQKRALSRAIEQAKPADLLSLRLEDMLGDPEGFAAKVSDFLGDPIVPAIDATRGLSLDRSHVISGNRWLTRKGEPKPRVVLREPAIEPELNRFESALFRLAARFFPSLRDAPEPDRR